MESHQPPFIDQAHVYEVQQTVEDLNIIYKPEHQKTEKTISEAITDEIQYLIDQDLSAIKNDMTESDGEMSITLERGSDLYLRLAPYFTKEQLDYLFIQDTNGNLLYAEALEVSVKAVIPEGKTLPTSITLRIEHLSRNLYAPSDPSGGFGYSADDPDNQSMRRMTIEVSDGKKGGDRLFADIVNPDGTGVGISGGIDPTTGEAVAFYFPKKDGKDDLVQRQKTLTPDEEKNIPVIDFMRVVWSEMRQYENGE